MLLRKVGGAIFSLAVSRFTSARDSEISQLGEQLLYLSRKIVTYVTSNRSILIIIIWIFKVLHNIMIRILNFFSFLTRWINFYIYVYRIESIFFWRGRRKIEIDWFIVNTIFITIYNSHLKFLPSTDLTSKSLLNSIKTVQNRKIENTTDSSSPVLNIHRSCDGKEVSVHRLKPLVTARPINKETFIKIWIRISRVGNARRRKKRESGFVTDDSLRLKNVARNACNTRVPRLNSKRIKPADTASLFSGNGLFIPLTR